MERKVVITGIGAITPVGKNLKEIWSNLTNGISGIKILEFEENLKKFQEAIGIKAAGQIPDFSLAEYFAKKAHNMEKDMDRVTQLAMAAAKDAIESSGLDILIKENKICPFSVGMFIGTGVGGISTSSNDIQTLLLHGHKKVGVRTVFRMMPNAAAGQIAIEFGLRGQAKSISTACASGLEAILDAYNDIKAGVSEMIVAGGTEACVSPLAVASFSNMRALSRRDVDPTKLSCPFSADRDGFVISEGAVIFILEEMEAAKKRGAKIYAEIIGGAATCDAYHITAPHPQGEGATNAMLKALKIAKLNPEDISYIHAHGTSTQLNDARETLAIKKAFGAHAYKLAISSTKSMTGHMVGAAGSMGTLVALQSLREKILAPTINYENPDPECDLDYVPNKAREMKDIKHTMINALGFGGHNTVLILK